MALDIITISIIAGGVLASILLTVLVARLRHVENSHYSACDNDPVYEHNGFWYFWDETWTGYYGPYSTEEIARENLDRYYKSLEV